MKHDVIIPSLNEKQPNKEQIDRAKYTYLRENDVFIYAKDKHGFVYPFKKTHYTW
jgi:hypothetical protein